MPAFTGRDVIAEFAIADELATVGSLSWLRLGMMRAKNISTNWDTADTTADQSPGFTRTSLVTFKAVEFSGDGVSYDDAAYNQKALNAHVVSPGSATANQPKAWFRLTFPDGSTYVGPFIVTSWESTNPYDTECTWSITANSNGDVVFTAA